MRLCFETTICWRIALEQRGKDSFRVTYGAQVKDRLSYGEAARELGAVIMHALACEDRLDNRTKGERTPE
jgi:hypothetical protein